jgi:hypothetical protein
MDGKHSNTALHTAGTADQPRATEPGSLSQRGIYNLNQLLIPGPDSRRSFGLVFQIIFRTVHVAVSR